MQNTGFFPSRRASRPTSGRGVAPTGEKLAGETRQERAMGDDPTAPEIERQPMVEHLLLTFMTDMSETIQESISEASRSRLNSQIAILVAITATFMALCNVKDGNVVQAMSQAQAHEIDAWSYYQAKGTKQSIAENALDLLKAENRPGSEALVKTYEEKVARYEKEKGEIKTQAEGFGQEYEAINVFDDQFDMTDAFLSIAIAMFGITALTQKRWLFFFSCLLSGSGITFGVAAFLHISLHSDFISRILG